jgi:predicted nucleic acid-binding protein
VVADAGPLLALAKINSLSLLRHLFGEVWLTPIVYGEAVEAGRSLGAVDAEVIASAWESGWLQVKSPPATTLPVPGLLGAGEMSSIALALAYGADWLLIDDADARRLAEANIAAAGIATRVKGTLGVLVSAHQVGLIDTNQAVAAIEALKGRPDIWISGALCDQVIALLRNV